MDFNTFDTYQAEIEYRGNRIRKDVRPQPPPRPGPVRTPARRGHPHRPLTASTLSSDEHRHGAGSKAVQKQNN